VKSSTTARIGAGWLGSRLAGADDSDEAVTKAAAPAERNVRRRRRTRIDFSSDAVEALRGNIILDVLPAAQSKSRVTSR
jgi:hypothetical protein